MKQSNQSGSPAILIFGAQGSGKSTQAEIVAETLNLPLFESGERLREIAHSEHPLAERVREMMAKGQLADNNLIDQIFEEFARHHNVSKGIVLDGFPRTLEQCDLLTEIVNRYHWDLIGVTLRISDDTAKQRLSKRFSIVDGQKVYREDDKPEIVEKRLKLYHQRTEPILQWMKQNYRLIEIDGEPNATTVTKDILARLGQL